MFAASSPLPSRCYPTVILSRFGPPFAVVAVSRIRFVPALRVAVKVVIAHVSQLPVLGNDGVAARTPSTVTFMGRLVVVPLEYRTVTGTAPAAAAVTAHST